MRHCLKSTKFSALASVAIGDEKEIVFSVLWKERFSLLLNLGRIIFPKSLFSIIFKSRRHFNFCALENRLAIPCSILKNRKSGFQAKWSSANPLTFYSTLENWFQKLRILLFLGQKMTLNSAFWTKLRDFLNFELLGPNWPLILLFIRYK